MTRKEEFVRRLREIREKRGLRQAELAKKMGLQPSAISQFETGAREPSTENIQKLASALEVTTDYLLAGTKELDFGGPRLRAVLQIAQNMSENDLEMLANFAEMLANKGKSRIVEGGEEESAIR